MATSPLAMSPNPTNLLLGRGKVFMDRLKLVSGVLTRTGEFDIGNCTQFEITPKASVKEKFESMDSSSQLYGRAAVQQTQSIKITGDEYSLFNLATALMGGQSAVTATGASVTGETLTTAPLQGAYYPTKFRNISAATVKGGATGTTALVLGTDYAIDATSGRVQILSGGAVQPTDTIKADYTYATYTINMVQGGTNPQINCYVRFKGNPVQGPTFEGEFWNVMFTPNGSLGLIQDDYGNWTLEGMCIADSVNHPAEPLYHLLQVA
jgi:hypothetical protein